MKNLLQNTLEIICNVSYSFAGYILNISSDSADLVVFKGEEKDLFNNLNSDLIQLYKGKKVKNEDISNLSSFKQVEDELAVKSFFVKELNSLKNNGHASYLCLFSNRANNYNQNNLKTLSGIISTLDEQINSAETTELMEEKTGQDNAVLKSKNKEFSLTASGQILKSLFNVCEDLIFVLDNNGTFTNVNSNGALLLDYAREELIGRHFLDFLDLKGKTAISQSFQQVLRSNSLHRFECVMISKSGKEITFEINSQSILDGERIVGMLGIAKDITKRRNYENIRNDLKSKLIEVNRLLSIERSRSNQRKVILEELNELKSDFISNISHELRTPLASIIGFSETIASDPEMPIEMKSEFNQIILQEGKRLAKLINDILDLSKIESGNIDLSKTDFDVIAVLREVVESYRQMVDNKSISLTCELPGEEVYINADKDRIAQIFHELISNAVKFTGENGRVAVIAQSLYREFELIVSDTGAGIPERDLPYIFQKFYRVSRPGTEIPGTGLGLVFVKQIVDLHKGLILVQSETNKGTSFVVKLPKSVKIQKNKV